MKENFPESIINLFEAHGTFRLVKTTNTDTSIPIDMGHKVVFNEPLKELDTPC